MGEPRRPPPLHVDDASPLPLAPGLLLFAPFALLANEVSSLLRYPELGSAVLFLPYAVLTAALVASPRRDWLWYILVGALLHGVAHWPQWSLSWVLLADVANIARAVVAAVLLRRAFSGPPRLDSMLALSLFVGIAAILAPAVGATIGAANVVLHGASPTYWRPWSQWFVSSALTALTVLPVLGIAAAEGARWRRVPFDRGRGAEAVLLAVALAVTCGLAFFHPAAAGWDHALRFYGPLPVLIWAAVRFGPAGASVALTVVALTAIWSADRGMGPFLGLSSDDNVLALQVFILLTTLPVLCLAVVGSGRQKAVQLHRALLLSLQDRVAILDARGIVLEVNDSWRRFADTAGSRAFDRVRAGEDYLKACSDAAGQGDQVAAQALAGLEGVLSRARRRYELEYEREDDGRRDWYAMSAEALERSDGGAVVTLANVTAPRKAQAELEEQREELRHLSRAALLGELSGALAHELGQPLASILSNAQAALRLLGREAIEPEELALALGDIVTEDRRAGEVIQRLRALFKRGETRLQPVAAAELVRDVLDLARPELSLRRVTATSAVEPDLSPVLCDRVQVQQVLLNLILNACEAMSETALGDRSFLLTARAEQDRGVHFSVRDCGTGIPAAIIDRLFEPFVTTKPNGLGLGLSISRTIVNAHGGRLWAENNPDRGATIHFLLVDALVHAGEPQVSPGAGLGMSLSPAPEPVRAASLRT